MLLSLLCVLQGTHAAGTECKPGLRENVDDVGVLYMNKWNGLDNDTLNGLSSLHYDVKRNWQIYDHI